MADPIQMVDSIANSNQSTWGTKILLVSANAPTYGASLILPTVFDS